MLHFFGGSIWRNRDLRLMLAAQAASAFGDDLALLALLLRVYAHGRGPWSITLLLLCTAAPVAALASIGGRLVDRVPFRRLAIATAAWQAACCVALALARPLWSTYLLVIALQTGQVIAGPNWQALLPAVAKANELGRAVSVSQATMRLAAVAAPAAAGVAVGAVGYGPLLIVDAATFVLLGLTGLAIRTTRALDVEHDDEPKTQAAFSLRADAVLWPLVVGICVLVLVGGVSNVVEVFLVRGTLHASSTVFGLLAGLLAAAIVVGALAAGSAASQSLRALRAAAAALALALALVLAGLSTTIWVFALAWLILGVANGLLNADVGTLLLERTPESFRGRILARVNAMVRSAEIGALALGGAAGGLLGPRATFVAGGVLMAAVAAVLLARVRLIVAAEATQPAEMPNDSHASKGGCARAAPSGSRGS